MIQLAQHIKNAHGGNVSAFAAQHGRTRQCVSEWVKAGVLWVGGRAVKPLTDREEDQAVKQGKVDIYHDGVLVYSFYASREAVELTHQQLGDQTNVNN